MKRLLFFLCLLYSHLLFAQFGPVVQYAEPREGMIEYAEGISLPVEPAGFTLYLPAAGPPLTCANYCIT